MNLKLDLNEQGHSEKVLTAVIFILSTEVTKHIINYNHQRARRIRRRADELFLIKIFDFNQDGIA